MRKSSDTYSTTQSEQRVGDLRDVLLLVQINGLENVLVGYTVGLQGLLEVVDVLHHLELATGRVDLGNGTGLDGVDQIAQNLSVLEHIIVGLASRELDSNDGLNPCLGFLILNGITFACDLYIGTNLQNIGNLIFEYVFLLQLFQSIQHTFSRQPAFCTRLTFSIRAHFIFQIYKTHLKHHHRVMTHI